MDKREMLMGYSSQYQDIISIPDQSFTIDSVIAAWYKLSNNQSIDVFSKTYIPFATDNENNMDDVYCVDTQTGQVYLLWVLIYDFFNPVEWQTGKFLKAATINEFLRMQSNLYR
jgi:hypothetical protein